MNEPNDMAMGRVVDRIGCVATLGEDVASIWSPIALDEIRMGAELGDRPGDRDWS